ncbi:MAG: spermidine synthase-like protein, partial [Proteobacteria bacterium]|nr:spermidine synthase-like protein [Pseudomonadota bacterium]
AVESHPVILSLLGGELAKETGDLLRHPAVSVRNLSSRTFLARDKEQYDLILLPTLDAFGGTSGLHAVREDYLLTREAIRQLWRKLAPGGAIGVTSWMDYPLRHPLKIVATLAEALEAEGVADRRDHLAAVRGWGTITILAKKTALTETDAENIRRFCRELRFDPAILPGLRPEERMRSNALQDERLFLYLEELLTPSRERFIADYAFNIEPATDDRPYFSQFLRWQSIPELLRLYGGRTFPFLEAGYLLVLMTLLQVAVAAVILILLPLRFLGIGGMSRLGTLLYFSGLGIGYMFVEIVLIQRFFLYLGNPLYAAAAVISGMLLCSGIGSLLSTHLIKTRRHALALFAVIVLMILLYALFLTPLLVSTIAVPQAGRAVLALLIIAPAAFVMGMPFP